MLKVKAYRSIYLFGALTKNYGKTTVKIITRNPASRLAEGLMWQITRGALILRTLSYVLPAADNTFKYEHNLKCLGKSYF